MLLIPPTHDLAVTGLMGCGKTSVGSLLAHRMDLSLRDSDADIEASEGMSGREIARRHGVQTIHHLEAEHVRNALLESERIVVCPAASIFDRQDCVELLRTKAFVTWIDLSPEVLAARLDRVTHRRWLADPIPAFTKMRERRLHAFETASDLVVTDPELTANDVMKLILERIEA